MWKQVICTTEKCKNYVWGAIAIFFFCCKLGQQLWYKNINLLHKGDGLGVFNVKSWIPGPKKCKNWHLFHYFITRNEDIQENH